MPFSHHATGYRQPAQASMFGSGGLLVLGLVALVALSIRIIDPPPAAIDAGPQATFLVKSIPFDPPAETAEDSATPPEPAPLPPATLSAPSPAVAPNRPAQSSPVPMAVSAPPAVTAPSAPSAPPAPAISVIAPPAAPARPVAPALSSASAAADWRARLLGHLKRYRHYPRQAENARQQGIARVAITLRRSGDVVAVELVRGSGYPLLDLEARATVRRASPLPAPDTAVAGDPITVEVPIDFALR